MWAGVLLQLLKQKFAEERPSGRLILYCEDTSKTYTSEFVAAVLDDEGQREGLFEARSEHLGVRFGQPRTYGTQLHKQGRLAQLSGDACALAMHALSICSLVASRRRWTGTMALAGPPWPSTFSSRPVRWCLFAPGRVYAPLIDRQHSGRGTTGLKSVHRERLSPTDSHFSTNRLRVYTEDPDTVVVLGYQRTHETMTAH